MKPTGHKEDKRRARYERKRDKKLYGPKGSKPREKAEEEEIWTAPSGIEFVDLEITLDEPEIPEIKCSKCGVTNGSWFIENDITFCHKCYSRLPAQEPDFLDELRAI